MIDEARAHPEAHGPTLAIGLALPCPVDVLSHDELSVRLFPKWRDVRLAALLHERFAARIFVDNDANCGAIAEALAGAGRDTADFIYIKVATGVGAGIMIEGLPFRGTSGIAGEIGHTTVNPKGRECRCGLRGCLEAEIGSHALVTKAHERLPEAPASRLAIHEDFDESDIVRAALAGDDMARAIVEEAGRYLGVAFANLVNLMNPGKIILGGRLREAGEPVLAPMRDTMRQRALWTSAERAEILLSAMGEAHIAQGAAAHALRAALADQRLFTPFARP